MTEQHVTCPQCARPYIRRSSGPLTGLPERRGLYYPIEKADWCQECRLGVRWFEFVEMESRTHG